MSIHAEHDAILRLPQRYGKIQTVNLMVIRTSPTGQLGESKPCAHCIQRMRKNTLRMGYSISHVYYSTSEQNIKKIRLDELVSSHVSSYFRYIKRRDSDSPE